jgi:hypothetical protein
MATLAPEHAPSPEFTPLSQYAQEATPAPRERAVLDAPYYTLDEEQIRKKVAAALVDAEERKAAGLATGEQKRTPLIIGMSEAASKKLDAEGRIDDIYKARVMAEAERPYRDQSILKATQAEKIVDTLTDPDSWWTLVRQPVKVARAVKHTTQKYLLLDRAANAAALAGLEFDRIVAAAMPFTSRLDISDPVKHFLRHTSPAEAQPSDDISPQEEQPVTEISPQAEWLTAKLQLDAQLAEQLQGLQNNGILKELSNGEMGISDKTGAEYPAPDALQLRRLVEAHRELVAIKAAHGFTRLLVIPQATDLATLKEKLTENVLARRDSLHDADGQPFSLPKDPTKEIFADLANTDTAQDAKTSPRHRAPSSTPGWKVVLIKNMPQLPLREDDVVVFGGRGEFIVGDYSARKAQAVLRNSPFCTGESGFSLQAWLAYSISELEHSGTIVDATGNTLLLGSTVRHVFGRRQEPSIGWSRIYNHGTSKEKQIQCAAMPRSWRSFDVGLRTMVELS